MKKELLIAILIGSIIGFGATGILWLKKENKLTLSKIKQRLNNQQNDGKESTPTESSPTPTEVEETKVLLEIETPENESIQDQENLLIKGKTQKNATVVIIWEEGEDILIADGNGIFETEITLVGGENLINISAYDDEGNKSSQNLTITYSTANL